MEMGIILLHYHTMAGMPVESFGVNFVSSTRSKEVKGHRCCHPHYHLHCRYHHPHQLNSKQYCLAVKEVVVFAQVT